MDIYIARQPIFDGNMRLYGYELLFRQSLRNQYEGSDDSESTIALLNNSFLVLDFNSIVDGTVGFMNFPANLIVSDLMYVLPKLQVVVEILERIEVTPEVVLACKQLKAKGYRIALDDFVFEEDRLRYQPLLDVVDIVKVDYPKMNQNSIKAMIKEYPEIEFLAEKVETIQEYYLAKKLGFTLFQGYFFARPNLIKGTEIGCLNSNLLLLIEEIDKDDPDFRNMERIITNDVGLSFKLMKMANFVYFGAKHRITSIKQALLQVGLWELKRWSYLMLLRDIQLPENEVLVNQCVIRGRMLSLIAADVPNANEFDYFATGIFSAIDVLLHDTMEHALSGLLLSQEVYAALIGKENTLRIYLDIVLAYERGEWESCEQQLDKTHLTMKKCTDYYMASISWQQSLSA